MNKKLILTILILGLVIGILVPRILEIFYKFEYYRTSGTIGVFSACIFWILSLKVFTRSIEKEKIEIKSSPILEKKFSKGKKHKAGQAAKPTPGVKNHENHIHESVLK